MKTYRKKPVIVKAVQFLDTPESIREVVNFISKSGRAVTVSYKKETPRVKVKTLEGNMWANVGDYVIRGVAGEFYPCKQEIFEQTYELVEE